MIDRTTQEERPTEDEIARCAYQIYEQEGRIPGRDQDHWLRAEAQLIQARQQARTKTAESVQSQAAATEDWRVAQDRKRKPNESRSFAKRAPQPAGAPQRTGSPAPA